MDNDLVYVKSICLFVDKNIVCLRKKVYFKIFRYEEKMNR